LHLSRRQNSSSPGNEKSVEEIKAAKKINSVMRNPASAEGLGDTVNVAKMSFEETYFDFGKIDQGDVVTHTYKFKNTGKVPLIISGARSTCGCTVPKWPKDPVPPGESGIIEVKFNSRGKRNKQTKPITITANTYPSTTKVMLEGFVIADETTAKVDKKKLKKLQKKVPKPSVKQ